LKFDMTKSGARLTWEYFHPGTLLPLLVRYVEDRDLGRIWSKEGSQLHHSRIINSALFSYTPSFDQWSALNVMMTTNDGFYQFVDEGRAIERKQAKDIAELTSKLKHRRVIGGVEVWCANLPYTLASDAANVMAEGEPFAATYFIDADGYAVFSLRSTETGMDVSEIAKSYGGGGHRQAAGFRIPVVDPEGFLGGLHG
jgi:oligoribonuclease NrnB/cAMP/cGMP phosphodiesterase (DHH superfamily)